MLGIQRSPVGSRAATVWARGNAANDGYAVKDRGGEM